MKRTAIALLTVLAVAGCGGGKAHVASPPSTATSTPSTTPPAPAAPPASATTSATTTASPQASAPPATQTTRTASTGGAAPTTQTTSSTTSTHTPTPAQIAEAKQALPTCQQEEPGVTLAQLEQEAASPEGIQC